MPARRALLRPALLRPRNALLRSEWLFAAASLLPSPNVPILLVLFIFILFYVVAICIFLSFLLIRAISSLNCCFEPLPCPQLSRISSRAFCAFIFVLRFLPALSSSPSGFNLATLLHISLPLRKSTATISIDTIPEIVHPFARARRSPCFFNAALGALLFSRRLLAQRGWVTSRLDRHHLLH
jgi:hypothetical protein